jgi:UDP-N-acetylmuramoylalanine--D-glutamate ligase
MKVAVVGLGMEGENAVYSLLKYGHLVYASDLKNNVQLDLDRCGDRCELDLGFHDWNRINSADAIVISPSLWNPGVLKKIKSKNKFLSNILKEHKSIFTIGVTGTNGKTTTSLMIKDILENSGFKVLIGGNAGGGFEGYTQIMLEAAKSASQATSEDSSSPYDFLIVEVCDMTLDFCSYNFDFDLMVVTNLGYDHLNVHGSLEKYQEKLGEFLQGKETVLNINDERLFALKDIPDKNHFFDTYPGEFKLFGKFNRQNAAAAVKVAELRHIPEKDIVNSLSNFNAVSGRTEQLNLGNTKIVIGKTDNISAISTVFKELESDVTVLGTPRQKEDWRFEIFKEVAHINPKLVVLFPGLENTVMKAEEVLRKNEYLGPIKIFDNVSGVIGFLKTHHDNFQNIFIGGNGQTKIMEIKKGIEQVFSEI